MPLRVLLSVLTALLAVCVAGPLAQQAPAPDSTTLDTSPAGTLSGTLVVPGNPGRVPVALIIAGSGPTDRDGNSAMLPGKNDAYRLLAEGLKAQGIASLRYDKRGIGASAAAGGPEEDLRFGTLVEDAALWIARLRNDFRFTTITVIGHSEGSLIGMLAARAARADAFVSIAGPGRPAGDVIRTQLRAQLKDAALLQVSESILTSLEAGRTVPQVPPPLAALFRPSVQPYLISWLTYSPADELARLTVPRLIVQGTTDLQVPVSDAQALKAAAPDAELRIIEGMNHVMKTVTDPGRQAASYVDPGLPLATDLLPAISTFIEGLESPGQKPRVRRPTVERRSLRHVTMGEVDGVRIGIEYGRPSKRGRVIWGTLVPFGRWWMPGADETTTLTTSGPLRMGTLTVPAGDYTIYTEPSADEFAFVVNRDTWVFHTVYDPSRDLGRTPMTRTSLTGTPVEQLTFAIVPRPGGSGGSLELLWDDRKYSVDVAGR